MGHYTVNKHHPSDEMLNQSPDPLWSLKIPGCPSKKSRGVTPASWPNSPIGLWPSRPPNHPHTPIGFITVSSPPVSWCVVGILAQYGCRHIIQVDAAHWWWLRRFPLLCKALRVPRKVLYKWKELLLLLLTRWKYVQTFLERVDVRLVQICLWAKGIFDLPKINTDWLIAILINKKMRQSLITNKKKKLLFYYYLKTVIVILFHIWNISIFFFKVSFKSEFFYKFSYVPLPHFCYYVF